MHIASLDNGSRAALRMFAEELLDLWQRPIHWKGKDYYVVAGQILMDGKGRESFCGVQGATSLAGCNICHYPGRTFGNRRVFDGARRYLTMQDTTRSKDSDKNRRNVMHFSSDEKRRAPKKRTYEEYKEYAAIAEEENRGKANPKYVHKGVKKLWCLDLLPYAAHIHWTVDMMHCFNNIITDMNNSLRPTQGGDKYLLRHTNRTTNAAVVSACVEEGKSCDVCQYMLKYVINVHDVILCHFMSMYILHHNMSYYVISRHNLYF